MATFIVFLIIGTALWFWGRDSRKKSFFKDPTTESERNLYYNLILSQDKDLGPRTYVVVRCRDCQEEVKCAIKIIEGVKGPVQTLRVDIDPAELNMHRQFTHSAQQKGLTDTP